MSGIGKEQAVRVRVYSLTLSTYGLSHADRVFGHVPPRATAIDCTVIARPWGPDRWAVDLVRLDPYPPALNQIEGRGLTTAIRAALKQQHNITVARIPLDKVMEGING